MNSQSMALRPNQRPFTMCLIEKLDSGIIEAAIQDSLALQQSYDPTTQTSDGSVYRGTALTYRPTFSGFPISSKDDTAQSDT